MRNLQLCLLILGACGGSSGQPVGYTLRFETLTATVPSDNDRVPGRIFPFGDGFVAFTSDVSITDGAGGWTKVRPLDHALGGAVLGGRIFALINDGVAVSTDGVTYTDVSDLRLTGLAAVGDTLLGVEGIDSFSARVVRSTDGGVTWAPSGLVYTETLIEIGSLSGLFVGSGPDVAWVRFTADADLGDNVDLLTQLWRVDASGTGELVGEDFLTPAPTARTADGVTVADLGAAADSLNAPTNLLSVAWTDGDDAGRRPDDYTRIHLVSEIEPSGPIGAGLLGVDASGHVVVTAHGRVMRSTTPVGPDGDQSRAVWRGPGCDDWVDRAVQDDDQPSITVTNTTGEAIRLRSVDPLNRWTTLQDLAPGATSVVNGLSVREQSLLMAAGADGTCFGVLHIPNKAPDDLAWSVESPR